MSWWYQELTVLNYDIKGKSINAKFYKTVRRKLKKYFEKLKTRNRFGECQIATRRCVIAQGVHCIRLPETGYGCWLPNPPYSPYLASYDFFLFQGLTKINFLVENLCSPNTSVLQYFSFFIVCLEKIMKIPSQFGFSILKLCISVGDENFKTK